MFLRGGMHFIALCISLLAEFILLPGRICFIVTGYLCCCWGGMHFIGVEGVFHCWWNLFCCPCVSFFWSGDVYVVGREYVLYCQKVCMFLLGVSILLPWGIFFVYGDVYLLSEKVYLIAMGVYSIVKVDMSYCGVMFV